MKKYLALVLTLVMALGMFAACSSPAEEPATTEPATTEEATTEETTEETTGEPVEITFWSFPIGGFGDADTVAGFIADFNAMYPDITVKHELLDYANGDAQVTAAIEAGTAPDIIMEGPERLVANWGKNGFMVDLSDMMTEETMADIAGVSQAALDACMGTDGAYYEYPMVTTAHVMAINYEVFEQAGALQYIDEETRTWTTENFVMAMEAVRDSGLIQTPGIVYCGGQGGDQGTRALVSNLYSGTYTNEDYTAYTINSAEMVEGLTLINDMVTSGALSSDAAIAAAEELQLFANGTSAVTWAWNAANEMTYAPQAEFTPFAMNFPSDDDTVELQGGIWGFGIFDNGDAAKIEASKKFIQFIADDETQGPKSVAATGFFPVRSSYGNVYAGAENEEAMAVYASFVPNLGPYYQVSPVWPEQRTAWWELLQEMFAGTDPQTAADNYMTKVETAMAG